MQLYSVEIVRRIIPNWEIFIFLDAAHLSKKTWEFGRMDVSVGYGLRCKILDCIPPLTLGMGYPLNARSRSDVKKFFISVGTNF